MIKTLAITPKNKINYGITPSKKMSHTVGYVQTDQTYEEWLEEVESYQSFCLNCGRLSFECKCNTHVQITYNNQTGDTEEDIEEY